MSVGRRRATSLANQAPVVPSRWTNSSTGQPRQRSDSRYGAGGPSITTTMSRSEVDGPAGGQHAAAEEGGAGGGEALGD